MAEETGCIIGLLMKERVTFSKNTQRMGGRER